MNEVIDNDGNVIKKGNTVVSGGDTWTVGYASNELTRLDRCRNDGRYESRLVGKNRLCCVHVVSDFDLSSNVELGHE